MPTFNTGDFITRPLTWSNAIRLGGVQLSRNFSTRPDIITNPLPQFSAEVGVPSTMDLFIDSYRFQNNSLDSGPFVINNTPYLNGAGEAVITTTDALGRTISTTIPFYVTPDLLHQGMSDYTISFGAIRQRYGEDNFSYGPVAMNGSYRYGINNQLTLELHIENSSSLNLAGIGATTKLGFLGTINAAYTYSHFDNKNGQQLQIGYQYISRQFNLAVQHTQRNHNYHDLSSLDNANGLSRQSTQITTSIGLNHLGNLSAGYFSIEDHQRSRTELIN